MLEGKLDVGAGCRWMGYSVGGTGAVDIGGHKAITTVVSIHGHSAKAELHGTLLLMGGSNDVMRDGQFLVRANLRSITGADLLQLGGRSESTDTLARTVDGVQSGVEVSRDDRLAPLLDLQRPGCEAVLLW